VRVKWLLFLSSLLLLSSFGYRVRASETFLASGSNFNIYLSSNKAIDFQGDYTLTVHVENGTLNGTNGGFSLYSAHGSLSFYSLSPAYLHVYSPNQPDVEIVYQGSQSYETNSSFYLSVSPNGTFSLAWKIGLESYVDKYTVLCMGLGGIFLMVFSPTWFAWKVRKSGADVETVERFGYCMLLFVIGFGLFITWLYS